MLEGDKIISTCAVFIYMPYCLEKTKEKRFQESHLNADVFVSWCCRGMKLEMVLLWIWVAFECCNGIRIPCMEKIWVACVVSCDLRDIGVSLKKWNLGGGTSFEEGVNIKGQS